MPLRPTQNAALGRPALAAAVVVRFLSSPYVLALLLGVAVFAGTLAYYGTSFH